MKRIETLFCKTVALLFRELFERYPLDVLDGLLRAVHFELFLGVKSKGIDAFTDERGMRFEDFALACIKCRNQIEMGLTGIDDALRLPPRDKQRHPVVQIVLFCCGYIVTFTDLVFVGILDGLNSMIAQCETLKRNLDHGLDCESNHAKQNVEALRRAFTILSELYPKVSRELGAGIPNADQLRRLQCVRARFLGGRGSRVVAVLFSRT